MAKKKRGRRSKGKDTTFAMMNFITIVLVLIVVGMVVAANI